MKVFLLALLTLFLFSCELEEVPVPTTPLKQDYAPGAAPGDNTGGTGNPVASNAPFTISSNDFSDITFENVDFYPIASNQGANTRIWLVSSTPPNYTKDFSLSIDIRNTSINQINLNGSYGIVSGFNSFTFTLSPLQPIGYAFFQKTDFINNCRISFSSFDDNNVAGVVYIQGVTTAGYSYDFAINFDIEKGSQPLISR